METRCSGCNVILTTNKGVRVEEAFFDSRLPTKSPTDTITFAWCIRCYRDEHRILRRKWEV